MNKFSLNSWIKTVTTLKESHITSLVVIIYSYIITYNIGMYVLYVYTVSLYRIGKFSYLIAAPCILIITK